MKNLTVIVVALLAAAAYAAKPVRLLSTEETTILNYHARVGVPEAKRIQLEEEQFAQNPSRIVGGSPAYQGTVPYSAGILITLLNGYTSVCGASLLSNNHLVTAAHCWWDGFIHANQFLIVLGSYYLFTGGFRIAALHVETHGSFNPSNNINDCAIVYTNYIAYTNYIHSIELPTIYTSPTFVGYLAKASGFGRTSDYSGMPSNPEKHEAYLQVISNTLCQQTFGANIFASSICTSGEGGVGICGGDSGGPLALDYDHGRILIGIASWTSSWGCQAGHPSVHVRTTSVSPWIRERLDETHWPGPEDN